MNEILLIMLWVGAGDGNRSNSANMDLVEILAEEILNDKHWHLALRPDASWRLKVDKPTNWFVDNTPGLYESAVEIRTQDVDSDDEKDADTVSRSQRVTILDAEFNVLHTCLALDVLGHCATHFGDSFSRYIFRCLHKVLLKVASSNTMVYQAANFCLVSIQKALNFANISELIEAHTDYLSYHLNTILKRSPESHTAVDILTVLLQLSTRRALPHLENIFQTIYNECSKSQQSENVNAFLRVFNAFLKHVARWQMSSDMEVSAVPMQVEDTQDADLLQNWLDILERTGAFVEDESVNMENEANAKSTTNTTDDVEMKDEEAADDLKPPLPRHIQMVKDITTQVLKFLGFVDQTHQILALECLIQALPLLHDYEDELLPLVHLTWSPLMERFRNNDAVVLNRCFTLLNVLATHAKEFILKRSLDDVIPNLKDFLLKSAKNSVMETITAHTQEYKLQVILLEHFANVIESLQIDGKHLNDIAEIVSLYLAKEQPKELQELAIQFYLRLRLYDGPLAYMIVLKKAHISNYKDNAETVLTNFRKSGSSSSNI
uniref:TELO2-interacting protein 1 n=2 Tax=Bactrocera latifrons TaxID=174628 RepID=A0A0K8W408_BACLA